MLKDNKHNTFYNGEKKKQAIHPSLGDQTNKLRHIQAGDYYVALKMIAQSYS